jgi:uncharacterized protein YegP (UPF0339 family)
MVFHLYQDIRNEWRWYLAAASGDKLATAAQSYKRRGDCVLAIKHMRGAVEAPMVYDNFGTLADVTRAAHLAFAH